VADADLSVHRAVNALLSQEAVVVHSAQTWEEALAKLRGQSYALLVLDPALSGSAAPLLPAIVSLQPALATRLVLLSSDPSPTDPGLAGIPTLPKPVNPREARALMRSLLGR
jgi:DNA-binding response OmpR family regulator